MKLLQKTSLYYLLFTLLTFLVGGLLFYTALRYMVHFEKDAWLLDCKKPVQKELEQKKQLDSTYKIMDRIIEVKAMKNYKPGYEAFQDTTIWNDNAKMHEPYRKFTYYASIRNQPYYISISGSKMESERLTTTIASVMLCLFILLAGILFLFNRFLSKTIWQPFYQTIFQIENFSFESSKKITSTSTDIEEFAILDTAIQQMTTKVIQDYHSLKQFTENASHEIQTPLAVIKSQIELLIQKADWQEHEWKALNNINEAASRLSKLNQALLLLTRIENQQYSDTKSINLKECIIRKLDQLEPMTEDKNLLITPHLEDKFLHINANLADILLNNLLGNAVKHNLSNGTIKVFLDKNRLLIRNTGQILHTTPAHLFKRFQKNNKSSASLGLGLAIVQQICERYDYNIEYKYEDKWHQIEVLF